MALTTEFLDAVAVIAERSSDPLTLPWPMPGNLGGWVSFNTFAEWRAFMLQFGLHGGIPDIVTAKFARAHKLHLLAWVDFDLIKAGELVALTTLELAVTDCYGIKERDRRRRLIDEKAKQKKRVPTDREERWAEQLPLADLLKFMVTHDGLTDDQVPMNRRCGPAATVVKRLTGEVRPSLAEIRNKLAHGYPFDGWPQSGLLELVRDLIEYAYRDIVSRGADLFSLRRPFDAMALG
ncbi:MAG TPA: hypothetical protein VKI44_40680 [Acetobacteraceae bacterium]|nr:hypothetical protein [Acetobacteraceae bacterium]